MLKSGGLLYYLNYVILLKKISMIGRTLNTIEVFGVSNDTIETYVTREKVDTAFLEGLTKNKHIIVYGASKQGKTSLTNKHLNPEDYIRVNCSPNSSSIDLYKSIIRQLGIEFEELREEALTIGGETKAGIKANVKIPFIGSLEANGEGGGIITNEKKIIFRTVEFNLELAQDISELLKAVSFNKRIILENFHYLNLETQKQLSIDLRIFEDYNILFIILGIWREKNRLGQYNGDLLDRMIEVPVEPWEVDDLKNIIKEGEPLLNVNFDNVIDNLIETCFDSVGVFQELCKETCLAAKVEKTSETTVHIRLEHIITAIEKKLNDYSSRHIRCLESFVEQKAKSSEETPLYIPYYFIKILLSENFEEVTKGLKRRSIQEKIKEIHHRPDDVRPSDMGYFLQTLVTNQIKKSISPPIFDFDISTSSVKIIDSTFYFFLKNCNKDEVSEYISKPDGI
jgi:hypothetical protein